MASGSGLRLPARSSATRRFCWDEATSALDQATEAAILATLRRAGEGRTVIFVTHRLSSAAADIVLVMERGHLVEAGGNEVLRRLWSEPWGGENGIVTAEPVIERRFAWKGLIMATTGASPFGRFGTVTFS